MAGVWAGYRYTLFTFLLFNPAFVLIISAQDIETGGLVGGGVKSQIYTLVVSIFSALLVGLVLWFDLTKKISIISEVRWELIWVALMILFNIIGIASVASNRPTPDTCVRPDSNWNICSGSGGIIALLILASIPLIIHAFILITMVVRQSGKTPLDVWSFIARELPQALKPTPPPLDFAPGITSPYNGMVEIDPGRPKSLPPVPQLAAPPPVAYNGRRDPFTFSSVSSLLNPAPRQDVEGGLGPKTYQLYDAPITPVLVSLPPVQKAFERVSSTGSSRFGTSNVSAHYAPTPVYEKFARGGREAPLPLKPSPSPPATPNRPRKKEGDYVFWHADDHTVRRARTQRERETEPTPARDPSGMQTLPSRSRLPRIPVGSLPNPNTHRV